MQRCFPYPLCIVYVSERKQLGSTHVIDLVLLSLSYLYSFVVRLVPIKAVKSFLIR